MRLPTVRSARFLALAAAILALAAPAEAYYQYVHFLTSSAPYTPVYERFDLSALLNNTVSVLALDAAPVTPGNDSFASVISQVQQAAAAWNSVSSSGLRVAFGGMMAPGQAPATPFIEVTFTSDLPPGVLAEAAPTVNVAAKPSTDANGAAFFPIVGSVVMLNSNTSVPPGPSYAETYYTTTIHELGHALGLQHTFTASAMSQAVIRNTNRQRPLDVDDEAALSVLYGKTGWTAAYGSISGQITSQGAGVPLASVVAIPPIGSPVSALTNPDGTYRIVGLPPGQYLLYVHPLPPDADVRSPKDASGNAFPTGSPFETVFFPSSAAGGGGTLDVSKVTPVTVTAGTEVKNQSVDVPARSAVPVYDLVTFSYFDPTQQTYSWSGGAVTPAFVNSVQSATQGLATLTFRAASGSTPAPQSATVLGGFNTYEVASCCTPQSVVMYVTMPVFPQAGPRHLVLNFGNDMYVLPDALTIVANNPPAITSLKGNSDGSVTIAGTNLSSGTQIFFDGLAAAIQTPYSGKNGTGTITVIPPTGFEGQRATVVAYNPDGQNSTTLDSVQLAYGQTLPYPPATYTYPSRGVSTFGIAPATLPAGVLAKVDITTDTLNFTAGAFTAGFGTSDVLVRDLWVVSPTHAIANVIVAPNAAAGYSELSEISGFRRIDFGGYFSVTATDPTKPAITAVTNAASTQATIYPGALVSITGSNLAVNGSAATLLLNNAPIDIASAAGSQVVFSLPPDTPLGLASLTLSNGVDQAPSVEFQVALPPPAISSVSFANGNALTPNTPATFGDSLDVHVTGLDATVLNNLGRLSITVGGVSMPVAQVVANTDGSDDIFVTLNQPPAGLEPLAVWVDGSSSAAMNIPIVAPPPAATTTATASNQ